MFQSLKQRICALSNFKSNVLRKGRSSKNDGTVKGAVGWVRRYGTVGTVVRYGGYGGTVHWVGWYGTVGTVLPSKLFAIASKLLTIANNLL